MKRTREQRDAPVVVVDAGWASLNGDLICAVVHAAPAVLPVLYRVSKHFHMTLALVHPDAPMWQTYFNLKPGYSDYTPSAITKWKDLVMLRHKIIPLFYLHTKRARFDCGHLVPRMVVLGIACDCGRGFFAGEHKIKEWVDDKQFLYGIKKMEHAHDYDVHELGFSEILAGVGFTRRNGGPARYLWCPAENKILYEQELSSETKEMRVMVAAARPEDTVDCETNWKIARFVGII